MPNVYSPDGVSWRLTNMVSSAAAGAAARIAISTARIRFIGCQIARSARRKLRNPGDEPVERYQQRPVAGFVREQLPAVGRHHLLGALAPDAVVQSAALG